MRLIGDQKIKAEIFIDGNASANDLVRITVVGVSLITDYNRDRIIDYKDEELYDKKETFYFWLNDDNDDGNEVLSDLKEDIPNASGLSWEDKTNNSIDGTRDLVDFFPVRITMPLSILDENTKLVLRTDR